MNRNKRIWLNGIGVMFVGGLIVTSVVGAEDGKSGGENSNHMLRLDTVQPAKERFVVLGDFLNAAVLDKETGLVWEKSPDQALYQWRDQNGFPIAVRICANKIVGERRGWRLPSVVELASLIDPSLPAPFVPTTVFPTVQLADYLAMSKNANITDDAWHVGFGDGSMAGPFKIHKCHVWCVRRPIQESVH